MSENHCNRCGAQIDGPFCSQCGYDNRTEIRTTGQLQNLSQPTVFEKKEKKGKKKKKISCLSIILILVLIGIVSCSLNTEKREAAKEIAASLKNYLIWNKAAKDLKKIGDNLENFAPTTGNKTKDITKSTRKTEPASTSGEMINGMRKEFKDAMDAYEAFYDEYCEFMVMFGQNPTAPQLLLQYGELLGQAAEMDAKFERWNEDEDMNPKETQYFLEVQNRVLIRLNNVAAGL